MAVVIENGLGLQAKDVPLPSLITIGKAIYGDEVVYVVVLAVIKIAILVMYCRVFPVRSFRIAAWILGSLTCLWSIIFIFVCKLTSGLPSVLPNLTSTRCISMRSYTAGLEFDRTWYLCQPPRCLHRKCRTKHCD